MTSKSPAYKAYLKRFIPASVLYVVAVAIATMAIPEDAPLSVPVALIALLPGLAIIGMIWAMGRLLIELDDEYLRMLEIQKALIATGFTLALCSVWGIIELYSTAPRIPLFMVFPLWCIGLAIAALWQKVRGV